MPRVAKRISESGLYHVIVRGNGKQILFESDSDRIFFIERVYRCFREEGVKLLAWCLMDNHVHLLVRDDNDRLSTAMSRVDIPFAQRFNASSGHTGHVFEGRYLRLPIESEEYLLEVVRYIHNNPESAGICKAEDYAWSSYQEYVDVPKYVDRGLILDLVGGRKGFKRFCRDRGNPVLRLRCAMEPTAEQLREIADDAIAPYHTASIIALSKPLRNKCLCKLRDVGFTLRQIERLTGIGKSTVHDVTRLDRR